MRRKSEYWIAPSTDNWPIRRQPLKASQEVRSRRGPTRQRTASREAGKRRASRIYVRTHLRAIIMPRMPDVHRFARRTAEDQKRVRQDQQKASADRRGTATERGYDGRWRHVSAGHLLKRPMCVCCAANGRVTAATLVDHIVPHRGCKTLFWDAANRQGLCDNCHSRVKAIIERRWSLGMVDADALNLGRPLPEFFVAAV
jgi:5-methylcytosine-specific restriction protein A